MTQREREAAIELCRRVAPHLFDDARRQCEDRGMTQAAAIFQQLADQLRTRDPATIAGLGKAVDLAYDDG